MARNFRRQRTAHPIADLNVTNLIDLGFMLLIIFMIATPLMQQEQSIAVNLPAESKRAQEKPDKEQTFQAIAIDRRGNYFFGSTRVAFEELAPRLAELARRPKPPVIRIRADLTLQWQQVVRLMDEIKKHELTKITFDTQTAD
ncbi:ExbD/TolR family protein [Opitutus terrae]|uniref:Biopolymer transport protein ExbD/TolR n=1 Tax=Opitutus terrae (strain DSM 11246 / JCM 15787 / PB90-1) TaxID=452637 RepID=B1ZU37_OPITP|nr:biopolymer transporter ExbD [Opitutus terrae]ACB76603.1 Biopolymer transport protein ExbD/TolR [Opitutus terrae PB90-1]